MHSEKPGYFAYWGKARRDGEDGARLHLLAYHCLDVAAVGAALLQADASLRHRLAAIAHLDPSSVERFLPFALALHDIGKFAPAFQDLKPELAEALQGPRPRVGYATRHDAMGLALWCGKLAVDATSAGWLSAQGRDGPLGGGDLCYLVAPWMHAVLGHHGQPAVDRGALHNHFHPRQRARADAHEFAAAVAALFGPVELRFERPPAECEVETALKPSSWMVAGLAVLCDWLGSSAEWFPFRQDATPLAAYWGEARARAARALEACGILPRRASLSTGMAALYPAVTAPRPMQEAVQAIELSAGPQLFLLEDLTGSGKTEAAVLLAHRLMAAGKGGGVFFALPTMATANAMYERIQAVVPRLFLDGEQPSVVLAHSAPHLLAGLRDLGLPQQPGGDYLRGEPSISTQCAAWIADSRKRALLAQVGVGTLDQALMAAMQVRHGTLRLLGVSRNVLVVDEVHAYDAYMASILERLLEFQAGLGGSAILLSATLPTEQRRRLAAAFQRGLGARSAASGSAAYPLVTRVDAGSVVERPVRAAASSCRRVAVKPIDSPEAAAALVVSAAAAGRRVCWIRNTVQDAIDAHALLVPRLPPKALALFHARFAMGDRLRIESDVLAAFGPAERRRESVAGLRVLVATQVVEQSLDLDFDDLITDLAPMDLVIQRAGRLHRHRRDGRGEPVLHVLGPPFTEAPEGSWFASAFPRAKHVYRDWGQVWLTLRELVRRGALVLPGEARALMDAVFSQAARAEVPAALERASDEAELERKVSRSIADGVKVDLPGGYGGDQHSWASDARVATRLSEPTTLVRLARLVDSRAVPWIAAERHAWELSQLQVARRKLAGPAPSDAALIEAAKASMPFVDDGMVTVVLRGAAQGFRGGGLDHEGHPVGVLYDRGIGLRIEKEG